MPVSEHPMQALAAYLPEGSFEHVVQYIHHFKVHLTVTRKRKSVLGDYRHATRNTNHRISVNGDLNKYEFLITLLHELAHLLTFEQYGNRVEAHGKEWKNLYSRLLKDFVALQIFPADIQAVLQQNIDNPAATANGETALLRVLRNYSHQRKAGYVSVEDLPAGSFFMTEKQQLFKKGQKRRKRYECLDVKTGLLYSFNPLTEVLPYQLPDVQ